ncbi:MAG: hypothetical protein B7O98_00055 [Zestosphaera tikiterensis]|uniref:Uncharacterized protein n=1 Tax=Zestosphaera tikiterensis TaxID=1973259 RepID=A0A2R7YAF9_9CREN|nr:MAG: hypothetical protein B7O98_00055 [Zestosphaera tikiterensis]
MYGTPNTTPTNPIDSNAVEFTNIALFKILKPAFEVKVSSVSRVSNAMNRDKALGIITVNPKYIVLDRIMTQVLSSVKLPFKNEIMRDKPVKVK